ncbi:hypothetical protein [Lysobacter sp. Root690]|uniref:hypothetical protein n=1 Tax=Lysobacter sp. Root690 TaxID=1736588 RepID=UPI0006FC8C5E|nr:hypothetical protein [Lysobacter sp. Root690]KRB08666.1 hypothetical protein ASD86_04905 [Lysobacter sp. Root690]
MSLRVCGALAALVLAASASARPAEEAASAAPGKATVAQASSLLDTMGFENVLRQMMVLVNDQTLPEEPREDGDKALLQRWMAATKLQPVAAQTAQRLAEQTSAAQLDEALRYFRSAAGQTELSCVRDSAATPAVSACIEQRGGEAQLRAHRAFADSDIENTIGDVLGDSFGPELFAAASAALDGDAALKRDVARYCKRRPTGLCAMVGAAPAESGS